MIIDVHAHASSPELLDFLCDHPEYGVGLERDGKGGYHAGGYGPLDKGLYDIGMRLESLASRNVDLQLVGPPNILLHWPGGAPDVEFARFINQQTAQFVAQGEGRLGGMATIAFGAPDRAADELLRAVGEHGFRGAHVGISGGEHDLDDPIYEQVWAMAARLHLFIYMHPANQDYYARFQDYTLNTVVLWPTETCVAVSRMICSGLLERHPGLKLCLAHGGGTLPYLAARLDRAYEAHTYEYNSQLHQELSKPPAEYLKQISVDTCVFGREQFNFLLEMMGAERMMFGTDYPFEIGDAEGEKALPLIDGLPPDDRDRILSGNAAAILEGAKTQ